jgi:hypothetical protein
MVESAAFDSCILRFTRVVMMSGCVAFVAWQSWKCFDKYIQHPQGTMLAIAHTAGHKFPAITVCADPDFKWYNIPYNSTYLHFCNLR